MGGGVAGLKTDYSQGGINISFTIKGFHADWCGWGDGEDHKHDVNVGKWNSRSNMSIHFGYQIPLCKYVRIIPVIGIWSVGTTTTDGYDWTVNYNGITNKTTRSVEDKGFDFGAQVNAAYKKFYIFAEATRYSASGGIGIEFGRRRK